MLKGLLNIEVNVEQAIRATQHCLFDMGDVILPDQT